MSMLTHENGIGPRRGENLPAAIERVQQINGASTVRGQRDVRDVEVGEKLRYDFYPCTYSLRNGDICRLANTEPSWH